MSITVKAAVTIAITIAIPDKFSLTITCTIECSLTVTVTVKAAVTISGTVKFYVTVAVTIIFSITFAVTETPRRVVATGIYLVPRNVIVSGSTPINGNKIQDLRQYLPSLVVRYWSAGAPKRAVVDRVKIAFGVT